MFLCEFFSLIFVLLIALFRFCYFDSFFCENIDYDFKLQLTFVGKHFIVEFCYC